MGNTIKNTGNSEKIALPINAWKLIESDNAEIIHLELSEYETIDKHINPRDVFFYVLEGAGQIEIDGEISHMSKGDCIYVIKNTNRTWLNNSTKTLKLLVLKLL